MRRSRFALLAAVVGPGVLAGLSDDDPAGITTYSILGTEHGYRLLWVLALSTLALIVYHELGARVGIVTGQGITGLVRERFGVRWCALLLVTLVVANIGTTCAEFAGVSAGFDLAGVSRGVRVPIAALAVAGRVLGGSFHRVEHIRLALATVFGTYLVAAVLAHPDAGAAARGFVVPGLPGGRDAIVLVTATVGTTLAPWGLAFIQSYCVDKRLVPAQLPSVRLEVITGAVMTGVIGSAIVIACAATLHRSGATIHDAGDAARALRPLVGSAASALFATGLVAAAALAASILPLSTAYSVCEALGFEGALDDRYRDARAFYNSYGLVVVVSAAIVLIPSVPLVPVLYLSQVLNAVLLLPLMAFLLVLGRDRSVMGEHHTRRPGVTAQAVSLALVAACTVALVLS